jgi:hypothetical protein
MKDEDFKIDMKVKIISKYNGLENSVVCRILKDRSQNYAYVVDVHKYVG